MSTYLTWLTDTYSSALSGVSAKVMLLGQSDISGALYAQDVAHGYRADVSEFEVAGDGYSTGGVAVTGLAVTGDDTNEWVRIDFDDVDFGDMTLTTDVIAVVLYVDTGNAATDILIGAEIFPSQVNVNGGYTYALTDDGFMTIGAA